MDSTVCSSDSVREPARPKTHSVAVGKASCALVTRVSGAGAPPNKRPSSLCPLRELSIRSITMDGTLAKESGAGRWTNKVSVLPSGHSNVFLLNPSLIKVNFMGLS